MSLKNMIRHVLFVKVHMILDILVSAWSICSEIVESLSSVVS